MLLGSEQLDAPAGGCGATGNPPHSSAGRAISDKAAYRDEHIALLYAPRTIGAALLCLTTFCAIVMVAVALGAK